MDKAILKAKARDVIEGETARNIAWRTYFWTTLGKEYTTERLDRDFAHLFFLAAHRHQQDASRLHFSLDALMWAIGEDLPKVPKVDEDA